jgi:hypothetical protein
MRRAAVLALGLAAGPAAAAAQAPPDVVGQARDVYHGRERNLTVRAPRLDADITCHHRFRIRL